MVLSERDIRQIMVKSTLTSDEVGKIRLDLDSEIMIVSKNLAQLNIKKANRIKIISVFVRLFKSKGIF